MAQTWECAGGDGGLYVYAAFRWPQVDRAGLVSGAHLCLVGIMSGCVERVSAEGNVPKNGVNKHFQSDRPL